MLARLATVIVVLVSLTGCGGSVASAPGSTAPGGASAAPIATDNPASGAPATAGVDLSGLDACTLLDEQALGALTGESGFITDQFDKGHCFWAVPRAGVPQYVEINVSPRPGGLSGYTYNPGSGCTSAPVPGIGSEAFGGICTDPQKKVFLVAWDRGVMVSVLVNEPKSPLTPADLGATIESVLAGLATP